MLFLSYFATAVAAYLIGAIPTGFLVAKARGVDIRAVGSGNIGATNAFRVLGRPAGTLVLLVDALKGFAAVSWLCLALPKFFTLPSSAPAGYQLLAGIGAVLGHNYTCWLKFKGGKGIATTAGVYLALAPQALGIALVTWIALALITRYVSVASVVAAVVLPAAVWLNHGSLPLGLVTTALGLLAILKHRKNIQRLQAGTENRIGQKTRSAGEAK